MKASARLLERRVDITENVTCRWNFPLRMMETIRRTKEMMTMITREMKTTVMGMGMVMGRRMMMAGRTNPTKSRSLPQMQGTLSRKHSEISSTSANERHKHLTTLSENAPQRQSHHQALSSGPTSPSGKSSIATWPILRTRRTRKTARRARTREAKEKRVGTTATSARRKHRRRSAILSTRPRWQRASRSWSAWSTRTLSMTSHKIFDIGRMRRTSTETAKAHCCPCGDLRARRPSGSKSHQYAGIMHTLICLRWVMGRMTSCGKGLV
eukprot:Rmarinus@m.4249